MVNSHFSLNNNSVELLYIYNIIPISRIKIILVHFRNIHNLTPINLILFYYTYNSI